jgi:hypothetical protein
MDTTDNHVIVTAPDRYYTEAYSILLIDFEWGLVEHIINPLRSSLVDLAIHVYTPHDNDSKWAIDVATSSNIVLMDLNQNTNNDIIKGYLISKNNVWYTGRQDLDQIWPRYVNDPLSKLLVDLDHYRESKQGNT